MKYRRVCQVKHIVKSVVIFVMNIVRERISNEDSVPPQPRLRIVPS